MTANFNGLEPNIITPTPDDMDIFPFQVPSDRSAARLRSLMRDWDRDGIVDEDESETELMVLLSGMVSVSDPRSSDA
jgi:hypothetical protein